jgi:hypothetical protein
VRDKAKVVGRWHDNRHTLVTELSESGAGDEVIMSIAGHVSRAMVSRYSMCGSKRSGAPSTKLLRANAQPTTSARRNSNGSSRLFYWRWFSNRQHADGPHLGVVSRPVWAISEWLMTAGALDTRWRVGKRWVTTADLSHSITSPVGVIRHMHGPPFSQEPRTRR